MNDDNKVLLSRNGRRSARSLLFFLFCSRPPRVQSATTSVNAGPTAGPNGPSLPVISLNALPLLAAKPLATPVELLPLLAVLFAGDVAAPDDNDEADDPPLREILLRM